MIAGWPIVTRHSPESSRVTIAGDSQCSIAAMDKSGGLMAPYFTNHVSEIAQNLKEVAETVPVDPVYHLPGPLNPADLPTRGTATVADLTLDGTWMSGPTFLYQSRDLMPLSRDFLVTGFDLPPVELRPKKVSLLHQKLTVTDRKEDIEYIYLMEQMD